MGWIGKDFIRNVLRFCFFVLLSLSRELTNSHFSSPFYSPLSCQRSAMRPSAVGRPTNCAGGKSEQSLQRITPLRCPLPVPYPVDTMHAMNSKTSSGSKCIIETKKAKEEFSGITEHENKRVQQVVDKENERILQTSQRNGAPVTMCPICLEEIPAIRSLEEKRKEEVTC